MKTRTLPPHDYGCPLRFLAAAGGVYRTLRNTGYNPNRYSPYPRLDCSVYTGLAHPSTHDVALLLERLMDVVTTRTNRELP